MKNRPNRAINIMGAVVVSVHMPLAVWLPDNILTLVPALRVFSDFMSTISPSIVDLAIKSSHPDVLRVVLSVSLLSVPVLIFFWLRLLLDTTIDDEKLSRFRKQKHSLTVVAFVGMPCLVFAYLYLLGYGASPPQTGGRFLQQFERLLIESRIFLGLAGAMLAIAISLHISFAIFWTRLLPRIYLH